MAGPGGWYVGEQDSFHLSASFANLSAHYIPYDEQSLLNMLLCLSEIISESFFSLNRIQICS